VRFVGFFGAFLSMAAEAADWWQVRAQEQPSNVTERMLNFGDVTMGVRWVERTWNR